MFYILSIFFLDSLHGLPMESYTTTVVPHREWWRWERNSARKFGRSYKSPGVPLKSLSVWVSHFLCCFANRSTRLTPYGSGTMLDWFGRLLRGNQLKALDHIVDWMGGGQRWMNKWKNRHFLWIEPNRDNRREMCEWKQRHTNKKVMCITRLWNSGI